MTLNLIIITIQSFIKGRYPRHWIKALKCPRRLQYLGDPVGSVVSILAFHPCGSRFESHLRPEPCMWIGGGGREGGGGSTKGVLRKV